MISLYVTCKDAEEGKKIADAIMKERAAGCVNMWPSQSIWRDDETGELKYTNETILIIKTLEPKTPFIEDIVRREGSYKAPCIAMHSVSRINREYKEWLGKVVV